MADILSVHSTQANCRTGYVASHHRPRVVLYSHDTMGLGHIRRNLLISQALSQSPLQPDILLSSGTLEASQFALPAGVDCLVLPSLYKQANGQYRSRRLRMALERVINLRKKILYAAIRAYDPDLFVVDNVPRGAVGELDITLEYLRNRGHCRCVLGMRDIRDDPWVVQQEWRAGKYLETIRRYYDEVWIYGDPAVYDAVQEYSFPSDLATRVRYTGYLDQRWRLKDDRPTCEARTEDPSEQTDRSFALCTVGGGQDGARLAETFVRSTPRRGIEGVVLAGPHMDDQVRQRLHHRAAGSKRLRVIDFLPEPTRLLKRADCVVSMGGYNTLCEVLSFGKRALIVPRVSPRKEQLIRAERMFELGLVDTLHPDEVKPSVLEKWIDQNVGHPPLDFHHRIDMKGLTRLPRFFEDLVAPFRSSYSSPIVHAGVS